jgi:DNA-binding MarR family transcriptional regulator
MKRAERQALILNAIDTYMEEHEGTPPTVRELSDACGSTRGTLSTFLTIMEAQGLVRRIHDNPHVRIVPNEAGQKGAAD